MPPSEQARWFYEEVHPHEPALRAYLQVRFPTLADHDDLVQETYVRLLRAKSTGGVRYPKAFIFTAARNVAFDLFRRRRANPIEFGNYQAELVALDPQPGADEALDQHYELEVLAEAVRALPDRCRQVIMLRYLDGLAYKEIAEQLNISPETVKVHLAKGIRRCAAIFSERGLLDSTAPTNGKSGA